MWSKYSIRRHSVKGPDTNQVPVYMRHRSYAHLRRASVFYPSLFLISRGNWKNGDSFCLCASER